MEPSQKLRSPTKIRTKADLDSIRGKSVIPKLSEVTTRYRAIAQSFDWGQGYYRNGSVTSLIQRGNVLSASVEGGKRP